MSNSTFLDQEIISILLVDDHPVFRKGLRAILKEQPRYQVCSEAGNSQEALELARNYQPNIALIDISLPSANGIELTKMLLTEHPHMRIIILSMHDEKVYALRAIKAGAKGYVMKAEATDHLLEALRKVCKNGIWLSPKMGESLISVVATKGQGLTRNPIERLSDREIEVFRWIGQGYRTKEIADALSLSKKTIETHRIHIKEKLGLSDAKELTRCAIEWVSHTL